MPDIVLINPHWYMACGNLDDLWLPVPNGLAYIASALRDQGYSVKIIDVLAQGYARREWVERNGRRVCRVGLSEGDLFEKLKTLDADLVGIGNMFSAVFSGSAECAATVRKALPWARVVMGGVHPTCAPQEVICLPEVDYVLCGEGEDAFAALIRHIKEGDSNPMPSGILWREGEVVKTSGPPEIIPDLDTLPMPAYDLLDMELYRRVAKTDLINRGQGHVLTMPIVTSRGCPYQCIFCAANRLNGRRWRGRSPENVVDEIELLYNNYGVKSFTIEDSNFSYDEARAIRICELILSRNLKIRWNTPNGLRADRITPGLVKAMQRSGCYEVTLAAEHGDQNFLQQVIRKGLALDDIFRAGRMFIKAGVFVSCFLMMGFPGETEKELVKTLAFGRRLSGEGIFPLFFICSPLPGTPMYQKFVDNGDLPKTPLSCEDYLCAFRLPLMKMPDGINLVQWRHKAMRQAYFLFLLRHPISFFRIPGIRKFLNSLRSFKNCRLALSKFYNQFIMDVKSQVKAN
jgi:anaerobic magnesium-protoporphyrin IX monomethyl ester cyclase